MSNCFVDLYFGLGLEGIKTKPKQKKASTSGIDANMNAGLFGTGMGLGWKLSCWLIMMDGG